MMDLKPIPWRVQQEADCWIGICDPLKLTVDADSLAELVEDITETLEAVFKELDSTGDLERVLSENGLAADQEMRLMLNLPFVPAITHASPAATAHC